ncbi:MAG: 50S ribosomal protein L28 [Parachlamydia sp.]|jgi:large subunit ribosomal protein L28|nr:MAG: 50S ribosomal protein L28 [Parachlamydia sp.]
MSKICPVTGKKTTRGYTYAIRGIAKKKKGIGLKVTGKTKRRFKANLIDRKIWFAEENRFVRIPNLSIAGLRTLENKEGGIAAYVRAQRSPGKKAS